ncbi:MAG TPA: asparagine--tRNA ligase, partial [Clostridia bacterium]|nr:asparagine--tRNA ligase [Clostridia bacterium]
EPEMAFYDLADNMELAEAMVKHIIKTCLSRCPDELEFLNSFVDNGLLERLNNVAQSDFVRMDYTDAIKVLLESGAEFQYPVNWGCDLQTEHERYLTEQVYKRPVFVVNYPTQIKAFYMRVNDDDKTVAAMDLLVPGVGEIIGGSQREERLDVLESRINALKMDMSAYGWYLELRKYGGVYHAGYGLGFERMVMYLTGMTNIRDIIPFPRTAGSLEM